MKIEWTPGRICDVCHSTIYHQVGDFFPFQPQICSHQRVDVQGMGHVVSHGEWAAFMMAYEAEKIGR